MRGRIVLFSEQSQNAGELRIAKFVGQGAQEDQLPRFLAAAEADKTYYPLFFTLARTGMRPGEAMALQWSDLDFEGRNIHVERSLTYYGEGSAWAVTL